MSGPPPAEVVEGLRNPYLDEFVPPRRGQASESYRNYKPLRPKYVKVTMVPGRAVDESEFLAAVDSVRDLLIQGAAPIGRILGRSEYASRSITFAIFWASDYRIRLV
jgi:hypothetical protein